MLSILTKDIVIDLLKDKKKHLEEILGIANDYEKAIVLIELSDVQTAIEEIESLGDNSEMPNWIAQQY